MIRTQHVLLRIAEQFFREQLTGLYRWDRVFIDPPEPRLPIPEGTPIQKRREEMEKREGKGKFLEKERIRFEPWEILIYSPQEKGPLGEVSLRFNDLPVITGPLDASTWDKIAGHIRSHQTRLHHEIPQEASRY